MSSNMLINGFSGEDATLLFRHSPEYRERNHTGTTQRNIMDNMYCMNVYNNHLTIPEKDLSRLYKVIDNNDISISVNGEVQEHVLYYADRDNTVIIELDNVCIDSPPCDYRRVENIFAPHGTDKANMIKATMTKYNIVKRDSI